MSDYTLHLGDCLEYLRALPDGAVDACVTDLPYGTTQCAWDSVIPLRPMWEQVKRILKPRGVFMTTASQPFSSVLVMSNLEWFRYEWIWNKKKGANFGSVQYAPLKIHESVLVFAERATKLNHQYEQAKIPTGKMPDSKGKEAYYSQFGTRVRYGVGYPRSIQTFPAANNWTGGGFHPTQKPVRLMEYLIRTYTDAGDTILDFAMGSGTTGVACLRTGRHFIGCEIDEQYFKVAQKRIADAAAQPLLLEV